MVDKDLANRIRQLILAWSLKHAPDLESAKTALEATGFSGSIDDRLGPHPDLLSWTSGGWVGPRLPMGEDEFHERVESDVRGLIDELLAFKEVAFSPDGPRWHDVIALVERGVVTQPADGFVLLAQSNMDDALRGAVVRAWQRSDLDETWVERIVDALDEVDPTEIADDVARLLADGGGGNAERTAWHRSSKARSLSLKVWSNSKEESPQPHERWLESAMSSVTGRIALYWVRVVSAVWSDDQEGWSGLSEEMKFAFDHLLGDPEMRSVMPEIVLASQVHFLFRADREWAQEMILPLLNWEEPERALRTWDGYLVWGRWEDALLDAGLFDYYMGAVAAWTSLSDTARERLCAHLAGIALYSTRDPLDWLPRFVSGVTFEGRVEWAHQVAVLLAQVSEDTVEGEWDRWIRRYWEQRLASRPRLLENIEASEMATWVVFFGRRSIPAGIELALRSPIGLGYHNDLLRLLDDDRFDKAPAAFIQLIAHALEGTEPPFYGDWHLQQIVARTRDHIDHEALAPLLEQAIRLGFSNALSW
jgi:hypothetical protein